MKLFKKWRSKRDLEKEITELKKKLTSDVRRLEVKSFNIEPETFRHVVELPDDIPKDKVKDLVIRSTLSSVGLEGVAEKYINIEHRSKYSRDYPHRRIYVATMKLIPVEHI